MIELLSELAIKSILAGGIVCALLFVLRSRDPIGRVRLTKYGLALALAVPLLSFVTLPAIIIPDPGLASAIESSAIVSSPPGDTIPSGEKALLPLPAVDTVPPPEPVNWTMILWAINGVVTVSILARLGLGLARLYVVRKTAARCIDRRWNAVLDRLTAGNRANRTPQLLVVADDVPAPASWGWLRPVITVDDIMVRSSQHAESVIAHELSHIERHDWLWIITGQAAVAIFWFNPFMWLLNRELHLRIEDAADADALRRVAPGPYAQTLLDCATRKSRNAAANTMATSAMRSRIDKILQEEHMTRPDHAFTRGAAMVAMLGITLPVGALALADPSLVDNESRVQAVAAPVDTLSREMLAAQNTSATSPVTIAAAPRVTPSVRQSSNIAPLDPEIVLRIPDTESQERTREIAQRATETRAEVVQVRSEQRASGERYEAIVEELREMAEEQREMMREVEAELASEMHEAANEIRDGADEMEEGAAEMERYAGNLRNRNFRALERERLRREQNRIMTDAEMQEWIPRMREGARGMREGARDMRRVARDMERQATRQD